MEAVRCESLTFSYPGADAPALQDVTLTVGEGERLGILGPNGGGKSTLLRIILGLQTGYSGSVTVLGRTPRAARRAGLLGYVAQRAALERQFPLSVRQAATMAAAREVPFYRAVPASVRARVDHALELVAMRDFAEEPVSALSGGQLQRVLIARAAASGCRLLALDEPTVGIDVEGQRLFAQMLTRVHREMGLTILIVSHDLRAIVAGCDRVACLARRLHSHVAPRGLTPEILAELFSHDVVGILGDLHLHAHAAHDCGTCPPPSLPASSTPSGDAPGVAVSVSAPRTPTQERGTGADRGAGGGA